MFGFTGGDNAETVALKKVYMAEAQERRPFLTLDASTIKNERQLAPWSKNGARDRKRMPRLTCASGCRTRSSDNV
jgi:hypothetical protein